MYDIDNSNESRLRNMYDIDKQNKKLPIDTILVFDKSKLSFKCQHKKTRGGGGWMPVDGEQKHIRYDTPNVRYFDIQKLPIRYRTVASRQGAKKVTVRGTVRGRFL